MAEEVIVNWCITAKVKGEGKPQRFEKMGSAQEAADATIAWLQGLTNLGDAPHVVIEAELTSAQKPGWKHKVLSDIEGMPAEEAIEYSCDWIENEIKQKTWGSGP